MIDDCIETLEKLKEITVQYFKSTKQIAEDYIKQYITLQANKSNLLTNTKIAVLREKAASMIYLEMNQTRKDFKICMSKINLICMKLPINQREDFMKYVDDCRRNYENEIIKFGNDCNEIVSTLINYEKNAIKKVGG